MLRRWRKPRGPILWDGAPPAASDHAADRSELPDIAARRAFLDAHVFVHTHIPKTAGSTLAAGLGAIVGGAATMDLRLHRRVPLDHMRQDERDMLRLVTGHFPYGLHTMLSATPLYVAAVRDPVARAVSFYRYVRAHPQHEDYAQVDGLDFAASWTALEAKHGPSRHNQQARMVTALTGRTMPEAAGTCDHVDRAYFLAVPHDRVAPALHALRAAFGIAWARVPKLNAAPGDEVEPDAATIRAVREVNAVDTALHAHICAGFEDRLARACHYIASRCLRARDVAQAEGGR